MGEHISNDGSGSAGSWGDAEFKEYDTFSGGEDVVNARARIRFIESINLNIKNLNYNFMLVDRCVTFTDLLGFTYSSFYYKYLNLEEAAKLRVDSFIAKTCVELDLNSIENFSLDSETKNILANIINNKDLFVVDLVIAEKYFFSSNLVLDLFRENNIRFIEVENYLDIFKQADIDTINK